MVRKYIRKTDYKAPDAKTVFKVMKHIKIYKQSPRSVAIDFKFPIKNVYRLCKTFDKFMEGKEITTEKIKEFVKSNQYKPGAKTVFSIKQEKDFIVYVLKIIKQYSLKSISVKEIRTMANDFAVQEGIEHPKAWKDAFMAGEDWYNKFRKRHPKFNLQTLPESAEKGGFDLLSEEKISEEEISEDEMLELKMPVEEVPEPIAEIMISPRKDIKMEIKEDDVDPIGNYIDGLTEFKLEEIDDDGYF